MTKGAVRAAPFLSSNFAAAGAKCRPPTRSVQCSAMTPWSATPYRSSSRSASAGDSGQGGRAVDENGRAANVRPHRRDRQWLRAVHQIRDAERGRNAPRTGRDHFVVGEAGERRLHRAVDLDDEIAAEIVIAGSVGVANVENQQNHFAG